MKGIKGVLALSLCAALLAGTPVEALGAGQEDFVLGIYSTTDMHGKCYDEDVTGEALEAGFLKVASAMEEERKANDGTILLDNGELFRGTALADCYMNEETGGPNPVALCLRYCGYDVLAADNREFERDGEGQGEIGAVLADESGTYPGTSVELLCANPSESTAWRTGVEPYTLRTFEVNGKEFRVGILSFDQTASAGEGNSPVESLAGVWQNRWQTVLREEENCDFVILTARLGNEEAVSAPGGDNQVAHLVQSTTGIDLVVAGRDHTPGVTGYLNAGGKRVPVVCGGGSALTKTLVRIGRDGMVSVEENRLLELRNYEDHEGLKALMEPYYEAALPYGEEVLGEVAGAWGEASGLYYAQSGVMNLIHAAQLWATGAELSIASPAAVNAEGAARLLREGSALTRRDLTDLLQNGEDRLYVVEMNGIQLKNWLERCAATYSVTEEGALAGGGAGTDQIANLHYEVFAGNPMGARVTNITYQDKPVLETQVFRVAVPGRRLAATAQADEYGWYAATGLGLKDALWDSTVSGAFGLAGGTCRTIMEEYIRFLSRDGGKITPPEIKAVWTITRQESIQVLASVTRLELVERLYTLSGAEGTAEPAPFADVTGNAAVNWAYQTGITRGNGSGLFLPGEVITREQAIVMLLRYDLALDRGPGGDWYVSVSCADAAKASVWSAEALMWNERQGYLTTDEENNLRPDVRLTKGELESALEKLARNP